MATKSEENRRKQQALINAGYRGVIADGSWGPYQQKLYLHYLANKLGPTKQQRINSAKQANQREAQISKQYFSQAPSIGNLAKGVYHWWNSIPALGGQNESGVQEYNVASNPVVASASPTKFNPKAFIEGWKNAGSFMNKAKYAINLYLPSAKNTPVSTRTVEDVATTTERLKGVDNLKRAYNTQSANLSEAEKQIEALTEANRKLQQEIRERPIVEWRNARSNRNFKPGYDAIARESHARANKKFARVLDQSKVDKAKEMAKESEIPVAEATNDWLRNFNPAPESAPKPSAEPPKWTPPTENVKPSSKPEEPEIPKKRGNLFWEGSDKPSASKYPNLGRHIRNWGVRVPIYTGIAAPIVDVAGNVIGAAQESDNQQHQWKFPVSSIRFTPERGAFKLISDSYSTQPKDSVTKKQSVEDDWLKQLDEAGKNVGY